VSSRRFLESMRLAVEGVAYCIKTQRNMKIHCVFALFAVLLGILLKISKIEFIILIFVIALVFICEIFNTAIERAVDTSTMEYHPIAKISKDVAAGAVLVSAVNAVIVGFMIFGSRLWAILYKIAGLGH